MGLTGDETAEEQRRQVLKQLYGIAFANVTDFVEVAEGGQAIRLAALDKMPPEKLGAIACLKIGARGNAEIRLYDKNRAIGTVVRLLGMGGRREVEDLRVLDALLALDGGTEDGTANLEGFDGAG